MGKMVQEMVNKCGLQFREEHLQGEMNGVNEECWRSEGMPCDVMKWKKMDK
jgi:hypothetical protein